MRSGAVFNGTAGAAAMMAAVLSLQGGTIAFQVVTPGAPAPALPFLGTVIDFEGRTEGERIGTQYQATFGVTFSQPEGGRPRVDNYPMYWPGYGPSSGIGVMSGSRFDGGAPVGSISGIVATFDSPVARVGAFFSDPAWLGDYYVGIFDETGAEIDHYTIVAGSLPGYTACGNTFEPPPGVVCGAFISFEANANIIKKVQFGPSSTWWPVTLSPLNYDAFAIDDLRWERNLSAVPEPSMMGLAAIALLALAFSSLRNSRRHSR